MIENMEDQQERAPKKNSNVIYFLIVVILALVGSDIYLFCFDIYLAFWHKLI